MQYYEEFQDLIEKELEEEFQRTGFFDDDDSKDNAIDNDKTILPKLDAFSLTLKDLIHEMEIRNLHPRGFYEDDSKVLQKKVDQEYTIYMESKKQELIQAKALEKQQLLTYKHQKKMEELYAQERHEMEISPRLNYQLKTLQQSQQKNDDYVSSHKKHFRIAYVNDVSARSLAKVLLLSTNRNILSLDLSHLNLCDLAGAFLCRSLKFNTSIKKIDLGNNCFKVKTCRSLGEALMSNGVVQFINLESNPLISSSAGSSSSSMENKNLTGIQALSNMLRVNKSLKHLNLWRCNINSEGCNIIFEAILKNDSLHCIEIGYNDWGNHNQICKLSAKLIENRETSKRIQDNLSQIKQKKEMENTLQAEKEKEKEIEQRNMQWLENQKTERLEKRFKDMDIRKKEYMVEMERQRKEQKLLRNSINDNKSQKKKKGKKKKG